MKIFLSLIAIVGLISCEQMNTEETLTEEQFIDIYVAMLEKQAQHTTPQSPSDSSFTDQARSILEEFGVNEEKFRSTIRSFRADPRRWQGFLDQVTKRLLRKIEEESGEKRDTAASTGEPAQH